MIFVSTGGFANKRPYDVCREYMSNGIKNIELSSGMYAEDTIEKLKSLTKDVNFSIHNYFPPPKNAFCINLASLNPEISKTSLEFCIDAISTAKELDSKFYSFHAGFLIDPDIRELGEKIGRQDLYNREKALEEFIKNIIKLSDHADKLDIELLIENNVYSRENFNEFNHNPFLMTEPVETKYIMENTPDNVNLLVDLGHLKVSANVLNFDVKVFFEICDSWIYGYHMSENDGESDLNFKINEKSWFWPFVKKNVELFSIEVFKTDINIISEQVKLVKEKIYGN